MSRVVVLGAGPAGLGAALGLAEAGFDVTVVERQSVVGGNAGSFDLAGIRVDYGSHRLHPAADPRVLKRLKALLGRDLLERRRHGRIRLRGRWIHFPLRPLDLALRLPPGFAVGAAFDAVRKSFATWNAPRDETFADVLERGLGRTICRDFYFPYARKIWGLEPEEISAVQAYKRVAAGSFGKLLRRMLPGGRGDTSAKGLFFYPRRGYGQISDSLAEAAHAAGAHILLEAPVSRIRREENGTFTVDLDRRSSPTSLSADAVWSTIPVTILARLIEPAPPEPVVIAARSLETRAMVLVYLVLGTGRFTEFDAHYFPESDLPFTRVSEPKNYSGVVEPRDRTVLCVEIPCDRDDTVWSADDETLGTLVSEGLADAGVPLKVPVIDVATRRLPHAYPRYRRGYDVLFDRIDRWLDGIEGLLTFGRQGLFVHDNTHHALYMADAAVEAFRDQSRIDRQAWRRFREIFATHVVED